MPVGINATWICTYHNPNRSKSEHQNPLLLIGFQIASKLAKIGTFRILAPTALSLSLLQDTLHFWRNSWVRFKLQKSQIRRKKRKFRLSKTLFRRSKTLFRLSKTLFCRPIKIPRKMIWQGKLQPLKVQAAVQITSTTS